MILNGLGTAVAAGLGFGGAAFNPLLFGAMIGMQALGHAFGPRQFVGPRLTDLSVQLTEEGSPIRKIYGKGEVAPVIIWSTGRDETIEEADVGGSLGPPPVHSASYSSSFADLICDGVPAMGRPLKIWENEHLVYDYNGGTEKGMSFTYDASIKAWVAGGLAGRPLVGRTSMRIYDGSQTLPDSLIEADKGVGTTPAFVKRCYAVTENLDLTHFGNDIPRRRYLIQSPLLTVDEWVLDICAEVGLTALDVDVTALTDTPVEGFIRDSVAPASQFLEHISRFMFCDFPTVDGNITAVPRSQASVATLPLNKTRVRHEGAENANNNYSHTQELELPQRTEVHFLEPKRNYLPAMRRSNRQITDSKRQSSVSIPAVMEGGYAQTIADVETWRDVIESRVLEETTDWEYLWLAPGDKLDLETNVGTQKHRLVRKGTALFGPLALSFVRHDDKIYGIGEQEDTEGPGVPPADERGPCDFFIAESHAVTENMVTQTGFLAGCAPQEGNVWAGAGIEVKQGSRRIYGATSSARAVIGMITAEYTLGSEYEWDEVVTLPATLFNSSNELSTVSDDALAGGANLLVFETGHILSFQTATPVTDTTYTLSKLRPRIGTIDIGDTIPDNTKFMVLTDTAGGPHPGVRWLPVPTSYLNSSLDMKIYDGASGDNETIEDYTLTGRNLKPLSPYGLVFTRDGSNGATLTGYLRSRYLDDLFSTDNPVRQSDDLVIKVRFDDGTDEGTTANITVSDPAFSKSWTAVELDALGVDSALPLTGEVWQVDYLQGYATEFGES